MARKRVVVQVEEASRLNYPMIGGWCNKIHGLAKTAPSNADTNVIWNRVAAIALYYFSFWIEKRIGYLILIFARWILIFPSCDE